MNQNSKNNNQKKPIKRGNSNINFKDSEKYESLDFLVKKDQKEKKILNI